MSIGGSDIKSIGVALDQIIILVISITIRWTQQVTTHTPSAPSATTSSGRPTS